MSNHTFYVHFLHCSSPRHKIYLSNIRFLLNWNNIGHASFSVPRESDIVMHSDTQVDRGNAIAGVINLLPIHGFLRSIPRLVTIITVSVYVIKYLHYLC